MPCRFKKVDVRKFYKFVKDQNIFPLDNSFAFFCEEIIRKLSIIVYKKLKVFSFSYYNLSLFPFRNILWLFLGFVMLTFIYLERYYSLANGQSGSLFRVWYKIDFADKKVKIATSCRAFSKEVTVGSWKERPGLTKRDYVNRKEMDEMIRVRMNWPAKLYRNDSR